MGHCRSDCCTLESVVLCSINHEMKWYSLLDWWSDTRQSWIHLVVCRRCEARHSREWFILMMAVDAKLDILENTCHQRCSRPRRDDCCLGACFDRYQSKRRQQQPAYNNQTIDVDLPIRYASWWEGITRIQERKNVDISSLKKLYLYKMYKYNFVISIKSVDGSLSIWLLYVDISRAMFYQQWKEMVFLAWLMIW